MESTNRLHLDSMALSLEHRERLNTNRVKIVENLENISDVIDHLLAANVIKDEDAQIVGSKDDDKDKTRTLLEKLRYRSEGAFYALLHALSKTQADSFLYNILKDDSMPDIPSHTQELPKSGPQRHFYERLLAFHKEKLNKLYKGPGGHDLSSYTSLTLHTKKSSNVEIRHGFRELYMIGKTGTQIQPEDIFAELEENLGPRSVLMLGAPGVGKTATCYFFLEQYTQQKLWNREFLFVFFILLRESNHIVEEITFQDLIFSCFGPSPTTESECERVWKYLDSNQTKILFVLDGLDEASDLGFKVGDNVPMHYQSTFKKVSAPTLLYNLMEGNILPNAHLLISARPHLAGVLQNKVNRIIELDALDMNKIQVMTNKFFPNRPQLAISISKYFEANEGIASLCSIPVNAKGLLNHIKEWHNKEENEIIEDHLPSSRAALMFFLILNSLHHQDSDLRKDPGLSSKDIARRRKDIIRVLATVAYNGLFATSRVEQLFHVEDLTKHGLHIDKVLASGLMTGHSSSVKEGFWGVEKIFLQFPHLTLQEHFAALKLSQMPAEDIEHVIMEQRGERDVVLMLCLGAMTDSTCQELLMTLYPDTSMEVYQEKAQRMLKAIWSAPRSLQADGPLFSITVLNESGLYSLERDLRLNIVNVYQTLNLLASNISTADCMSIAILLNHAHEQYEEVVLRAWIDVRGLQNIMEARSLKGLTLITAFKAELISLVGKKLGENCPLQRLSLFNSNKNPSWCKLRVSRNYSLKCLRLGGALDTTHMQTLYETFSSLHNLQALVLSNGTLSPFSLPQIKSLKYLRLVDCGHVGQDIKVVVDTVLTSKITWLAVRRNMICDEGAALLAHSLQNANNVLEGLVLTESDISNKGFKALCGAFHSCPTLRVLDLGGNVIGSDISPVVDLLHQNVIEELYLDSCDISSVGGCHIMDAMAINSSLTVLILGNNDLNTTRFALCLRDALECNDHLLLLGIDQCGLSDSMLNDILSGLTYNVTLQLLDISDNTRLTDGTICQLFTSTKLKHLVLSGCELGVSGWRKVGRALAESPEMVACMVGDKGREDDLEGFVEEMVSNPQKGRLCHLHLCAMSVVKMASKVNRLRQVANYTVSIAPNPWSLFILYELVWRPVPTEIRNWISTEYAWTY